MLKPKTKNRKHKIIFSFYKKVMGRFDHGDLVKRVDELVNPIISYLDDNYDKTNGLRKNTFNQLFKSLTSIGANLAEANVVATNPDFKRILSIVIREANESIYWLKVMKNTFKILDFEIYESQLEEIIKIIKTIIKKTI